MNSYGEKDGGKDQRPKIMRHHPQGGTGETPRSRIKTLRANDHEEEINNI